MPFAQLNGQKIHYRDSGGRGPVVVLSHGFLMDSTMFDSQVAALSDKFRVITWDERGFGDTEYDGKPFTYWDSANDCLALMTHLGVWIPLFLVACHRVAFCRCALHSPPPNECARWC